MDRERSMNGNLRVKDRITYEQGKLFQCLNNGWVKVLMDCGEVREYQSKDLIGILGGFEQKEPLRRSRSSASEHN